MIAVLARERLAVALLLAILSTLAAMPARADDRFGVALERLPALDESGLEPAVARQLASVRKRVERTSARADATAAELATAYGEFAEAHHAYELYREARAGYRNATALAPEDPKWRYLLGQVEIALGDGERASVAFARALELAPHNVPVLVELAELRRDQGRTEEALDLARRARAVDPRAASPLIEIANAALDAGDFAAAAAALEEVLRLQPGATKVYLQLAAAYRGLGRKQQAAAALARRGEGPVAIEDPWLTEVADLRTGRHADSERGVAAFQRGDYAAAADAFRRAVAADPRDARSYQNLGATLYLLGDERGAREAFEHALEADPRNFQVVTNLAVLATHAGDFEGAERRFRQALAMDPKYVNARIGLGGDLLRAGKPGDALAEYRHALTLDPGSTGARLGELKALLALRDAAGVGAWLERTLARPQAPVELQSAAVRVLAAGPIVSLHDGARALAIARSWPDPRHDVSVAESFAMALAATGDFAAAADLQRRALATARGAGREELARRLEANLRDYEGGRLASDPDLD